MMHANSLGLKVEGKDIWLLDQRLLPHKEVWTKISDVTEMIQAIQSLHVRGAPLIGVAAAFSIAQSAIKGTSAEQLLTEAEHLYRARPTAVNLMWAVNRMRQHIENKSSPKDLVQAAQQIFQEDVDLCNRMADWGAKWIESGDGVLTHCNSGGLATAGVGTAFGVLRRAHELGKKIHVWVDETRPLLQGARLTAWECQKFEIPHTLICDNMSAHVMSKGKIQKAITGADRIAVNGDFANKIGTYGVAVLCAYHNIPFAVAAPYTTVDLQCPEGKSIPIEERKASEVHGIAGAFGEVTWAPSRTQVHNPAFDVTPAALVHRWVLDKGIFDSKQVAQGVLKENVC